MAQRKHHGGAFKTCVDGASSHTNARIYCRAVDTAPWPAAQCTISLLGDETVNEAEYYKKIDASFPYDDEGAWTGVIDEGISISDNGAYMALHEICGAPPEIPQTDLANMLAYWDSRYDHPTKSIMLIAARAVVRGEALPEQDILQYLDEIGHYPGLSAAAAILWWAGPRDSGWPGKSTDKIEQKYREITDKWHQGENHGIPGTP